MIKANIETEVLQYNMKVSFKKDKGTTHFDVTYLLSA